MENALMNMLLGMGTVFSILILIYFIISCFKVFPHLEEKHKKNEKSVTDRFEEALEIEKQETDVQEDNTALIAVIAAAIAEYTGRSTDSFIVRKIKRR